MSVFVDEEEIIIPYNDVRNDGSDTQWATVVYENEGQGKKLQVGETGTDYSDLLAHFEDDARVYAYVRFETGDEMSRRAKFVFITWIGSSVSPLKKAKVSTDKAFLKAIWNQFGKEMLSDEKSELKYEKVLKVLEAASGAAYGTGK